MPRKVPVHEAKRDAYEETASEMTKSEGTPVGDRMITREATACLGCACVSALPETWIAPQPIRFRRPIHLVGGQVAPGNVIGCR